VGGLPPRDRGAPGSIASSSAEIAFFEANWPGDLPAGVIHADLFPTTSSSCRTGSPGLIDFYFACNDLLAYDVAICLNAWCFEIGQFLQRHQGARPAAGIRARAPAGRRREAALPLLARGAALRFLLTRLYDWVHTPPNALVKRKDPQEYLAKLRFHRGVTSLSDYGL
jgi:homoserine kinase type II